MKFIDWFSGVGGFRIALEAAGLECAASCEIDPFCGEVQYARFGRRPEFLDISKLRAEDLPDVPLWCGGFPCQDLSVAGKRGGLRKANRSGLVWKLLELAEVRRPAWIWLENVAGLFTSSDGADLGLLLARMADLWPCVGWRTFDAQFFGVPQRRRRVFIVGGPRAERVEEVLFEPQGRAGNHTSRGEARSDPAGDIARCVRRVGGGDDYGAQNGTLVASSLTVNESEQSYRGEGSDNLVIAPTVTARQGKGGFTDPENDGIIAVPKATAYHRNANCQVTDQKGKAAALKSAGEHSYQILAIQDVDNTTRGNVNGHGKCGSKGSKRDQGIGISAGGVSYPLGAGDRHGVAIPTCPDKAATLTASSHPNSSAPARKREDDDNLVVIPPGDKAATLGQRMRGQDDACAQNLVVGKPPIYIDPYAVHNSGSPNQDPVKQDGKSDALSTVGPGAVAFYSTGSGRGDAEGPGSPAVKSGSPPAIAFEPRYFERGGKAGGAPSDSVDITNAKKAGDSAPVVAFGISSDALDRTGEGKDGTSATRSGFGLEVEKSQTVKAAHPNAIARMFENHGQDSRVREVDIAPQINAKAGTGGNNVPLVGDAAPKGMSVRRLTPTETERLQGYPDGFTCQCGVRPDCPDRRYPEWLAGARIKLGGCGHSVCGCKCPDSPRYRVMGNSVALPNVVWIAKRIAAAAS